MRMAGIFATALIAAAGASAQTSNDAPLPSAKEYFDRAAEAQACNGGAPAKLPELEALRTQTLDYYRTKLKQAGSDPASASAVRALEANVVPADALAVTSSMRRIAADWAGWCRSVPFNIRYSHARHDVAMAAIGWPGAMPLDEARQAVAALEGRMTRVLVAAPPVMAEPPPVMSSAKPDSAAPPIRCKSDGIDILQGSRAAEGNRYSTATGLTVTTPAIPGAWTVGRCNAGGVVLAYRDVVTQGVLVAMAIDVGLAPWTDEKDFEERVRHVIEQNTVAGVHRKVDDVRAVTIDGRPCVDIRRSGTVDFMLAPDGHRVEGPIASREFTRTCHLRDRRGPDAAVVMAINATGLGDMASFDDAAKAFVDGVTLPSWMR